jgi:hypothetical protein
MAAPDRASLTILGSVSRAGGDRLDANRGSGRVEQVDGDEVRGTRVSVPPGHRLTSGALEPRNRPR